MESAKKSVYALVDDLGLMDIRNENLSKDVITFDMLRHKSMLKAYESIKPIIKDLQKTLNRHPEVYRKQKCVEKGDPVYRIDLVIDEDDRNYISLKPYKHFVENFIHTMTQLGMRIWHSGVYGNTYVPSRYTFTTEFSEVEITVVHPSMTTRSLWACSIIATMLYALHVEIKQLEPRHEMESEPKQAVEDTMQETEVVTVAQNTAITQEVDNSENVTVSLPTYMLQEIATTELLAHLSPIAERFVRIFDSSQTFNITDTVNMNKFILDIPNSLYSFFDSTIVSALRSYTLIRTDVEILIKVNANQAQCGRYIVSHFPCEKQLVEQARGSHDSVFRMLQRDHSVIDISKSNDVVHTMPYENLRPWLPIQADELGAIVGGSYATARMRCLSRLRIADAGNPICPYQVFARLKNTVLAGMRFPTAVPSGSAVSAAVHEMERTPHPQAIQATKSVVSTLKAIPMFGSLFGIAGKILGNSAIAVAKMLSRDQEHVKVFEDRLNYIGMTNKDRPVDITHPTPLLPLPVHSYSYGRTPYHSKKLRLEPEATVPHFPEHGTVGDTQSILDIARTPGYSGMFTINETTAQGDLLIELPVIPYDPRYANLYPHVGLTNNRVIPPVAYTSFMYNFTAGSLVYEFVPVKTPSHNFSIQVGFVPFNGAPGEVTETQLQSCRWKVIDFRASENGQFTVPWLSSSVVRNTPHPMVGYASANTDFVQTANIFNDDANIMKDPGKVVVRLVNELNPTPIVSPLIEVLVFVKAHENMRFMSPTTFRAVPGFYSDMNSYTRSIEGTGYGPAVIPTQRLGNFDFNAMRYEMQREPDTGGSFQHGDEQTMMGDTLREAPGPYVQTMEDHNNILDINRRFFFYSTVTGIFSSKEGATSTNPFPPFAVIPITPYSQVLQNFGTSGEFRRNAPMTTPRDATLACFRWLRGSVNVVIHSITDIPLEITYIPPNDYPYAISGDAGPVLYSNNNNVPIFSVPTSTGQPTEILDPRLNPIQTFEIPFYNLNNYIDLQALMRNAITNPTIDRNRLQDIASLFLGNLVIRGINGVPRSVDQLGENNFKVRISMAFGDDCKVQHFLGVPPVDIISAGLQWNMIETPDAFRARNRTRNEIETDLLRSGIESNPGPVLSSFFSCKGLSKSFTNATSMVSEFSSMLKAPAQIQKQVEECKMRGVGFLEEVKRILAAYTEGISILQITTLAISIVAALHKNSNVFATLSVLCQILSCAGVFGCEIVDNAMGKLSHFITNGDLTSAFIGESKEESRHEMESDSLVTMASVFSSLIIETFVANISVDKTKVSIDESYVKQIFSKTFRNFNIMRAGALCMLMSRVCGAVGTLYTCMRKWIRGLEKHDILTDDPEFIRGFMQDYEFFMDERNLSAHSLVQKHRDRFWSTVLTAYYLRGILATVDKKHVNTTLSTAVKDVITRANSLKSHMMAPPVRYEPFSLWLWGPPGTGKSKMMGELTVDMAKNIECKYQGDPIYVRSPHSQWWNGYDGQPIITIDDANGVNDPLILGRMISEFQAIKTSAKMRLEMPRLEEKNAEMSSVIMGVCSNVSEWISSMIVDANAFRRRRDVVVQVLWSKEAGDFFKANPLLPIVASSLPKEKLVDDKHLIFAVHNNPMVTHSECTYMDKAKFHKWLLERHQKYHESEVEKMMARYEKSLELSKQSSDRIMDKSTLKSALLAVLLGCESSEVISETMKRALYELEVSNPQRYAELPIHTRNILKQMKRTDARHEAPNTVSMSDLVNIYSQGSQWFREVLFPAYTVGNTFLSETCKEFLPWRYEDQRTFNSDLITTACAPCREPHDLNHRRVAYICANSTEDNQHWVCEACKPAFENLNNNNVCPSCRSDKFLKVTPAQSDWRWYSKVAHFTAVTVKKMANPLRMTFDILWQNACVLSVVFSISTLSFIRMYEYWQQTQEIEMVSDAAYSFLLQYGMLPTKYYYRCNANESRLFFEVDDQVFRDEGGYNFKLFEAANHEGPTDKPIPIEIPHSSKTSTSSDSSRSCHTPHDLDFLNGMPKEKCNEGHADEKVFQMIRRNKATIHYEDDKFLANVKVNDEVETSEIPCVCCEELECVLNKNMRIVVKSFYESRVGTWNDALRNERPIFPDEDPIPEFLKNIFRDDNEIVPEVVAPVWYKRMIEYQKELLITLKGRVISWFEHIYTLLCEKWKYVLSFIAVAFALYFGIKYYYSEEDGISLEPVHEGASQPRETAKGRAKPNTRMYVKNRTTASHEMKLMMNDRVPENVQNIANIVFKNQFSLKCAGFTVYGVALRNNQGWFPRHSFDLYSQLQEAGETVIFQQGDVVEVLKDRLGMYVIEENIIADYVIFSHKRLIGRDLRSHIYTTVQNTVAYASYAYGVDLQESKVVPIHVLSVTQNEPEDAKEMTTPWTIKGKTYSYTSKMVDYLTVVGFRGDGKCGSPMISPEGKIIAIHFGGAFENGSDVGYSAPVFREQFMFGEAGKHEMMSFPNLKVYARYPNPPFHTGKTKLRPSAIADKSWPSKTVPCIQTNKDPRYKFDSTPLLDGAATIGAPTNPPKQWIMDQAIRAVADELISNMPTPAMVPPVTMTEAVTARNHSNVESMNLKTSAGLPWIADFPSKNLKSHYIVHDVLPNNVHQVKFDPDFLKKYKNQWQGRTLGIPPREPFWAHLKDERRKPEKVESYGGTRVFNVSPLELVLSSRRALLPMMDAFHSDPVKLHHAIGLSPDSVQWTQLIESLRRKSDKIIQLDFKKFSDSMPWQFVKGAFYVIAAYYTKYNLMTPELWNILNTVYFEITQSLILVNETVYELLNGVLQGHPITSLINSVVNLLEQVYVWIDLTCLPGSVFFKECGIVVMGDDVVIAVPKKYLREYNGQTIAKKFFELNIIVTDENKQVDVVSRYQNISRFDFLSCSYYLHPYRALYLAPSDPESIFDTALWIKRKDGPFFDATKENVEQSLMNCFGHGPCIYEMYRATLEFLTGFEFRSWFELDYLFYCAEGDPERSVIMTNLGVVTGTSPKSFDLLEARAGRNGKAHKATVENQYYDMDFLASVRLDTQGIETGKYKCGCRYDCEKELLDRIKYVESKTNTPRAQFLPFTSQEDGTRILGAVIDVCRTAKPRGCSSIIAIEDYVSVTSDSAVGDVDGMRDRVHCMDSSTDKKKVGLQTISSDSDVWPGGLVVVNV